MRFVGVEAYLAAGGGIMRDLFEPDDGGWLTDPALLDRLADEKLKAEGERIKAEGWKWVATAVALPYGVADGMRTLDGEEIPMTAEEDARVNALQERVVGAAGVLPVTLLPCGATTSTKSICRQITIDLLSKRDKRSTLALRW